MPLTPSQRRLWRAARDIAAAMNPGPWRGSLAPLSGYFQSLERQIQLRDLARRQEWARAQCLQERKLRDELLDCRYEIDRIVALLPESDDLPDLPRPVPSASEVYRDLVALGQEFEGLKVYLRAYPKSLPAISAVYAAVR